MAPPSKRPPQGRKPSQGKRPTQAKRPPQARKPAQPGKPASSGASTSGGETSVKAEAGTATEAPASAETSRIAEERKAKREAARQERIALARQKQKAKRRKRMMLAGVLAVALLGATVYGIQKSRGQAAASKKAAEAAGCGPVLELENQGRNHIPLSEPFTNYNSNPPTSGPHYLERVANWGSYQEETPQTTLVHNLEHGGIVIHYKGQSEEQISEIDGFVDSYQDGVISNPNEKIDKPIVIASWTHMQKCERFSPDAVAGYIREHCNKGPEKLTTCRG
jgi:uncharacterized protein DUF3105